MNIFVSYSQKDSKFVHTLTDALRRNGFSAFDPLRDVKPGDSIPLRISKEISKADVVLLVLSKASTRSKWVKIEWSYAISLRESHSGKRIIPILLDSDVEIPFFLKDVLWLDFRNSKTRSENISKLIETLRGEMPSESLEARRKAEKEKILAERGTLELEKILLELSKARKSRQFYFLTTITTVIMIIVALLTSLLTFTDLSFKEFEWLLPFVVGIASAFLVLYKIHGSIKSQYMSEIERLEKYRTELEHSVSSKLFSQHRGTVE